MDGLRALAIGGVLLFHLGLPGAMLGWAGVQLFFVVSGFLITRILLVSREDNHPFRSFYIRRALRIFPIYYLYILLMVVIHLGSGVSEPLRFLPLYGTYTQNIPSLMDGSASLLATQHTWSLAVEEQFYWLWPMAVLLLPKNRIRYLIGGLFLAAPLWRLVIVLSGSHPLLAVGTLPAQIDAIAVGGAIAYAQCSGFPAASVRRFAWIALWLGTVWVALLSAIVGLSSLWHSRIWVTSPVGFLYLTGIAVLFGGVVALVVVGIVPRFLTWRPLMQVGRISYGIYLYHALVFFVVRRSSDGILEGLGLSADSIAAELVLITMMLTLSYGVAALSWRLIEQPLLGLKDRLAPTGSSVTESGGEHPDPSEIVVVPSAVT
ncbi:MAG: acyltransferase [Actinomycetota bacterium]|nr:acyltransferase [Actinomycetota bacterium]